jgi:hypothetical protein
MWVGAGVHALAELPLRGRWSMLFLSGVDYRYGRAELPNSAYLVPYDDDDSWNSGPRRFPTPQLTTHELQLTASVLPVFHLFEALVFGLGPTVTEHVRLASSMEGLDRAYLSLGFTSLLAGSF